MLGSTCINVICKLIWKVILTEVFTAEHYLYWAFANAIFCNLVAFKYVRKYINKACQLKHASAAAVTQRQRRTYCWGNRGGRLG